MSDTAAVQVTRHAPRVAGLRRSSGLATRRFASLSGAALLLLAALPGRTAAEPTPLDARVVWVRGPYAYVAARDSLTIAPFSGLTFTLKSNPVATAEVERTVDGGMVVARITSGSLAGVKQLDRLRIIAEPPERPRLIRLGCPSVARSRVLVAGDTLTIATPDGDVREGEPPSFRLVRNPDDPALEHWPDTLLVRTLDDPTDMEIALERGELDIAMFHFGGLSSRMRENPRWKERLTWPHECGPIDPRSAGGPPQIVCRPELLPYLRQLGPGTLAALLQCVPLERRP